MANDTIRIRLTADAGQLKSVLASTSKAVDSFASKAGGSFSAVSKNLLGLAGLPATKGEIFVAAGRKLLQFGAAAVQASAQTEAAFRGVEAIFGKSASRIEEFGKSAADSFGLSEKSLYSLVTPIGALVKGLGFSEEQAARTSMQFARIGADLAAAFPTQGGPAQAVNALGAALRGEYDPAERFGIGLSETTVKAKMLAMGLDTTTDSTKLYNRAQAVLALVTERTASIQGQFGKSLGSVQGRIQVLKARAENLAVAFGKELTPTAEYFLETAEEMLPVVAKIGSAFADLVNWFSKTSQSFADWTNKYFDFVDKVDKGEYEPKSLGDKVKASLVKFGLEYRGPQFGDADVQLAMRSFRNLGLSEAGAAPAHIQALSYLGNIERYGSTYGNIGDVLGAGPYSQEALRQQTENVLSTNIAQLQAELGAAGADVAYIALEGAAAFDNLSRSSDNVTTSFESNKIKAEELLDALSDLTDRALEYIDVTLAYQEADEKIADAQDNLIDKQEAYNEAVAEFGSGSREAQRALREITYAQNDVTRSADAAAKAYADQMKAIAEKSGQVFGEEQYLKAYVDELDRLAKASNDPTLSAGMAQITEDLKKMAYQAQLVARDAKLAADGITKIPLSWAWASSQTGLGMLPSPELDPSQWRADGGPVTRNQPYVVGERGPEMFVPGQSGTIVPNHALGGGGGGVTINVGHYYGPPDQFVSDMSEALRRLEAARR